MLSYLRSLSAPKFRRR